MTAIRTLLIDNYDSFTFNLYQLIAKINGELPIVIRNDQVDFQALAQLEFDNIIISPGAGNPSEPRNFGICDQVIQRYQKPILGICLGHQGIGHGFGGKIIHAPEVRHGRISQIYHHGSDLFQGIPDPFSAVRYHSLIVEQSSLPECLEVTAWTCDRLIMGLKHRHRLIWGVQFHPESICTDYGDQLLANFRDITRSLNSNLKPRSPQIPAIGSKLQTSCSKEFTKRFAKIFTKKLAIALDPEQVFVNLYGEQPYAFWLDSSRIEPNLSRFSFMGDDQGINSLRVEYCSPTQTVTVTQNGKVTEIKDHIFNYLQAQLNSRFCESAELPFDFNCGFVGYLGYELKSECGDQAKHISPLPDASLILATQIMVFDHQEQTTYLVYFGEFDQSETWFKHMEDRLQSLSPLTILKSASTSIAFDLRSDRQTYINDIKQCLVEIQNGESYEICLTNRIHAKPLPNPLEFYRHLRHQNPAPYAAFFKFGDLAIACSSPERFLKIDRTGWIETKPIKGTRPRGQTPEEDLILHHDLSHSEKDRAENLMVCDLLRNDLGIVCDVGTVHVPQLMQVETYATVHHLVSTIRGHLRADLGVTDCIRAAFPGGSMTGAPKLRTMEIIDRLEPEARGIYSGAIGFLGLNATMDLNIVIRSAVMTPTQTSIGIGGGIVAMSVPDLEFEETLLKSKALIQALQNCGSDL